MRALPVISVHPVTLPAPDRGTDLQVRVSVPITGHDLPVLVFSHGFGQSATGYEPLAAFWASHGFVVVQPTHLDSRTLNLPPDDPRTPSIWRIRVDDLTRSIDGLDVLEAAVPGLAGRVDRSRIAVAGHSWGAQTASTLLGARVVGIDEDLSDPRVTAGVLLAVTGTGGADLSPFAAEHFPFMSPSFSAMTTPTLVVAGDRDDSPLSVRGPDWFTDAYHLSPGDKSLLTLFGAEHSLGGVAGYESAETTDENPERVALVQRLTWAYLRDALGLKDSDWPVPVETTLGRLEQKFPRE
ncbi:alpha/beta hydrolase family protein [Cryptosporangium aurantiacum]|uniref:Chlorophyllase enzyme n=1 Tax=Cryptosporangium aurantiacum TaxID=134849 RepID=A0A1M7RG11_9ACTN|nr:alpha/beta fold hydrolase [Cryptosporangium aurantiacum]SHN45184.1 Chlorophyllase enzyme [Cryptosporangium aurantiacum]